jgi:polysaccharide chain length determinant protein (PEP-CTERM system associated)
MDGLYEQLRLALQSVWRRRWLALAVAWGVCLLGWLVVALIPNSYEAKARVLVQAQSILPNAVTGNPQERQAQIVRIKQNLTSTANLEKVVRRTDLNLQVASPRDLSAQVAMLREKIKVTAQLDDVIEISATSSVAGFSNAQNARTSAAIVQGLLDLLVEGNIAGDRAATGQTLAFVDEELKKRETALQEAEQRRVDFETKFLGLLPGEGSMAQRLAAARAEIASLDQQLAISQSALGSARGQLAATPPTIPSMAGGGGYGPASSQLSALEAQLAQFAGRGWTGAHPDVVATRAQIERLRPQAAAERRGGGGDFGSPNPVYVSMRGLVAEREGQVAAAMSRKNQLQADMAQLAARQTAEPEVVAEQTRLNRDYEVLKRQYDKLLEDREQLRLRSDVNSKTDSMLFQIVDRPSIPTAPAFPNRPLLLTLILIVAIGGGVAAAFVAGQLQTTFPTQNRLEQVTGLPVLGTVSQIFNAEQRAQQKQRLLWLAGGGGALVASYAALMVVEFWQRSTVA